MQKGHGGEIYDLSFELGIPATKIRDFSSNVSSYPLLEGLVEKVNEYAHHIRYLPQINNTHLIKSFANYYDLDPSSVLAGNGTTEFIYLIPRLLKPQRIVVINPTYADYLSSAKWNNLPLVEQGPLIEKSDYIKFIKDCLLDSLQENDLIFLCNPNNPTGHLVDGRLLLSLIKNTQKVYWVVDESYIQFLIDEEDHTLINQSEPNLIILRSFSKILGVPGLRLGFMIAHPSIIKKTKELQLPWNINTLAQKLGEYILSLQSKLSDYINSVKLFYSSEKNYFLSNIKGISEIYYFPNDAHFMLFCHRYGKDFSPIHERLKKEGLLIRHCSNFRGLDASFFRICPRSREDNDLLIEKIRDIMSTSH